MSACPPPLISVLIITHNRAHLLARLLDALWAQDFPSEAFEIVIIDDGSTDETQEYLRSLGDTVRWSAQKRGGVAKARNASARNARGRVLAFTDDDCLPARNWLSTIDARMKADGYRSALLGRTYSELPASTFVHSVFVDSEHVVTCNLAVTQKAFEDVGGFDEHFSWYFEDTDLGIRLKESGTPVLFVPEMVVYHPSRYQGFTAYVRQRRGLQFYYYMRMKHPEADVWKTNREVFRQIRKKILLFGIPLLLTFFWRGGLVLLLFVLSAHIIVDIPRLWRSYSRLEHTGLTGRPFDLVLFTLLNWAVPFVDAFQLARGWIRDAARIQKDAR